MPETVQLHQNYPNPFNPETTIIFDLPATMPVTLKVYDLLGQEVAAVLSGTLLAGRHQVRWDATGLPSGVYLYRLGAGTVMLSRLLSVVK